MLVVYLRLTSPEHPLPDAGDAARVHDALWAHTPATAGLEHVRARAESDGVALVLFIRNPDSLHFGGFPDMPLTLCEVLPALHPWRLAQS